MALLLRAQVLLLNAEIIMVISSLTINMYNFKISAIQFIAKKLDQEKGG